MALAAPTVAQDPGDDVWTAARKGDLARVEALLDERPDLVRARDGDRRTPLHLAARFGKLDVVRLLLARGAPAEAEAYNRFRPLHLAITGHRVAVVEELLPHVRDLEAKTSFDRTALQLAVQAKRADLVKLLRAAGARYDLLSAVSLGDAEGVDALLADTDLAVSWEVLEHAVRRGSVAMVRALLPRATRRALPAINTVDQPLLFLATAHVDVVRVLVEAGHSPTRSLQQTGMTGIQPGANTLHLAAERGHVETVRYLVGLEAFAGEGLEVRDARECTAVHFAAAKGRAAVLEVLREAGAELLAADRAGRTIVHHAALAGRVDVLRWLVARGIALDGVDRGGRNALVFATRGLHPMQKDLDARVEAAWVLVRHGVPADLPAAIAIGDDARARALLAERPALAADRAALGRAISFGRLEVVRALLDAGADLHGGDEHGNTALHDAALWRQPAIATLLLERGAELERRQRHGRTPLHDAVRAGTVAVARLLLDAGAATDARDKEGHTPADHLQDGHPAALKALFEDR